jgi:hypothetical protein
VIDRSPPEAIGAAEDAELESDEMWQWAVGETDP